MTTVNSIVYKYIEQFDKPYYATMAFYDFLKKNGGFKAGESYLDIGAGFGCVTHYFATQSSNSNFLGVDYSRADVEIGNKEIGRRGLSNLDLVYGDWFKMPQSMIGNFDGIFNNHTFCCFRDFNGAAQKLIDLKPRWIAFNSLFWDGNFDVYIRTRDIHHEDGSPDGDFNICGLWNFKKYLIGKGYGDIKVQRFEIPKSLPQPKDGNRGTYTVKTEWSSRTQFSGPIHLPWHFVMARKK